MNYDETIAHYEASINRVQRACNTIACMLEQRHGYINACQDDCYLSLLRPDESVIYVDTGVYIWLEDKQEQNIQQIKSDLAQWNKVLSVLKAELRAIHRKNKEQEAKKNVRCYTCLKMYRTEQEGDSTDIYVGMDVNICLHPCSDGKEHYICFSCYCELGTTEDFTVILPVYCIAMLHNYHSYKYLKPIWCVIYTSTNMHEIERIHRKLEDKAYRGLCGTSYADSRLRSYRLLTTNTVKASKAGLCMTGV